MRLLCIVFRAFSALLASPQADENGATPFLPTDTLNFAANDISNFWINSGLEDAARIADAGIPGINEHRFAVRRDDERRATALHIHPVNVQRAILPVRPRRDRQSQRENHESSRSFHKHPV